MRPEKLLFIELFKSYNRFSIIIFLIFIYKLIVDIGYMSVKSLAQNIAHWDLLHAINFVYFKSVSIYIAGILFGIFIIQSQTNDFRYNIFARHLVEGYTKKKYVTGKILLILLTGIVYACFYYFITLTRLYFLKTIDAQTLSLLIDFFTLFKVYIVFIYFGIWGLLFAVLLQKSLISSLLLIVYITFETLILFILSFTGIYLDNFFPFKSLFNAFFDDSVGIYYLIVPCIYLFIAFYIIIKALNKRDL